MEDLNIDINSDNLVTVYYDCQVAISFSKNAKYHSKSKHIETKYNFIKEFLAKKEVAIQYMFTHSIITNPLAKTVTRDVFASDVKSLGLRRL